MCLQPVSGFVGEHGFCCSNPVKVGSTVAGIRVYQNLYKARTLLCATAIGDRSLSVNVHPGVLLHILEWTLRTRDLLQNSVYIHRCVDSATAQSKRIRVIKADTPVSCP